MTSVNSFLYRMPYGVPGDVSRQSQATIEAQNMNVSLPFSLYGLFGKLVSNKFVPITTADLPGSIYGLLLRPYPTQGVNASDPLGTSVPKTSGLCDVLVRGYAFVKMNFGTAAAGNPVYIRVANPAGAKVIGGIEATQDGANTILVPNCAFMADADGSGTTEIRFNI